MVGEISEKTLTEIIKRLDAIIRLILEAQYPDKKFNEGVGARILRSTGLTPTEIAKIFGKKRTDISKYLYSKKRSRGKNSGGRR
jgi:hypothetical protein